MFRSTVERNQKESRNAIPPIGYYNPFTNSTVDISRQRVFDFGLKTSRKDLKTGNEPYRHLLGGHDYTSFQGAIRVDFGQA